MVFCHAFVVSVFLGWVKHPYVPTVITGQTEGFKVGCGGMAQGGSIGFDFARRMREKVRGGFRFRLIYDLRNGLGV